MNLEVSIMLLQFRVKNYKSIADEITLDMVAGSGTEHKHFLIEENGVKILPIASIYGSNASGKSNIIKALYSMFHIVATSYKYSDKDNIDVTPFLYDAELRDQPTEFEVSLAINGREYQYGFSASKHEIFEEWLYERKLSVNTTRSQKIFERRKDKDNKQIIEYSDKYIKFKDYDNLINKKMLVLNYLGIRRTETSKIFSDILFWFFRHVSDEAGNKEIQTDIEMCASYYYNNSEIKNSFINFINEFDSSLEDIDVIEEKNKEGNIKYRVFTVHKGERYPLDIESDGTKKLFCYYAILFMHFNISSGIFISDELDSQLHPLILRRIVNMYHDKNINKKNSQLVFTSHNLIVLDNRELRRDEIWFTEKNAKGFTNLYSLAEFKTSEKDIRSDMNYGKNYLAGKFGAIPYLKQLEE